MLRGVPQDIIDISERIEAKSKREARVENGYLKRSIGYVVNRQGVLTFTEVFYGQFGNSTLAKNIKDMLPRGTAYNLIYTDEEGQPYEVVRKTASGRIATTTATKATTIKSLGLGGIRNFLNKIKGTAKDEIDGEA